MPFEQAKRQFETKTNQAPKKVEGNWKDFTGKAKSYLAKKQQQVSSFIDSLDYPNKKQDKQNYISEMGKAIDDVIDGNEATKKEMAKYNGLLYSKSNQLKIKLLREKRAMEVRKTKEGLSGVVSHFQSNGIPLDTADNVKVYLSIAKEKRIPLKKIHEAMTAALKNASSVLTRKEMIKNKNIFYTIFNHYCWGNKEAALKETKKLNEYLDFYRQCDNIRQKTGLKLNDVALNGIMSGLIKTGVPKEKVDQFIIKNFAKLQKVGGENFNKLLKTLSKPSLSRFLLTALISINEGKSIKALEGIKMTMQVESTLVARQKETGRKLKNMYGYLKNEIAQLKEYRKKHPKVTMNKEISRLQKEIAVSLHSIAGHKKNLLLIAAQRSLANSFMSMKGMNPASGKEKKIMHAILNATTSQKLELLAVDKCGFAKIPQITLLQAAEMKFAMATNELEVKKWYEKNPMIDHPLNLHDVFNEYYKTGKLSFGARRAFNEQFAYQANSLRNLLSKNDQLESHYSADFEDVSKKYENLSKIPKEKSRDLSMTLTGHILLLKNMHAASVKLQGNLESLLIMSPGDEKLKKELKEVKVKAKYYADQLNKVSKFIGLKTNPDIADVDSMVESPLFGPLIQKEINPHIQSMNSYMGNVGDAARPIPYIGKKIQRRAKQNPRMVNYEFDKGIGQIVNLASAMKAARTNALGVKSKIEKSLKDTSKIKGLPRSIVLQREKYLKNVLAKLDIALKDPKSPLSLNAIKKVNEQRDKIVAAQEKYNREGFWKGVALAVIMAGAVAFAVAGGWAAGALGAKLFGTTATGTFAAGLIPVGVGVSKFAIGSLSMMGVAAGSVIGSRVVMSGFDALDLVDFGGAEKIWKPEDMMDDYATSFTISLLAVGAAKGVVSALKHVSTAKYFAFRFPGLVKFSRGALNKIQTVSKIASPSSWFQSGRPDAKSVLRHFGAQVGEEMGEEGMENVAGKIHPALEFLVSVASSADGMNMKLSMNGIKAADVGIVTEGSKMAYTTATPQEFVTNFKKEFATKNGVGHDATINADGSVTLDLFSYDIDPKTGQKVQKTFSTIKVHPANLPTNLTPEIEMTRVAGLKAESEKDSYSVSTATDSFNALADLHQRGFNITSTENGTFKISKGEKSFVLKIPNHVIEENQANFNKWLNSPEKELAYRKFSEFNGNYQAFLKKHKKLAKLLPSDLHKVRFIPTVNLNRLGVNLGNVTFKSVEQLRSTGKSPEIKARAEQAEILLKAGLREEAQSLISDSNFLGLTGHPIRTVAEIKSAVRELTEFRAIEEKLEHEGLNKPLSHIKQGYTLDESIPDRSDFEYKLLQSRALLETHQQLTSMQQEIARLCPSLKDEANYLTNYSGSSMDYYPTFASRIGKAQELLVLGRQLEGIDINPELHADISYFLQHSAIQDGLTNILLKYGNDFSKIETSNEWISLTEKIEEGFPSIKIGSLHKALKNELGRLEDVYSQSELNDSPIESKATLEQRVVMAEFFKHFADIKIQEKHYLKPKELINKVLNANPSLKEKLSPQQLNLIEQNLTKLGKNYAEIKRIKSMTKEQKQAYVKGLVKEYYPDFDVSGNLPFNIRFGGATGSSIFINFPHATYIQMEYSALYPGQNWNNLSKNEQSDIINDQRKYGINTSALNMVGNKIFVNQDRYKDPVARRNMEMHEDTHTLTLLSGAKDSPKWEHSHYDNLIKQGKFEEYLNLRFQEEFTGVCDEIVAKIIDGASQERMMSAFENTYWHHYTQNIISKVPAEYRHKVEAVRTKTFQEFRTMFKRAHYFANKIKAYPNGENILRFTPPQKWGSMYMHLKNKHGYDVLTNNTEQTLSVGKEQTFKTKSGDIYIRTGRINRHIVKDEYGFAFVRNGQYQEIADGETIQFKTRGSDSPTMEIRVQGDKIFIKNLSKRPNRIEVYESEQNYKPNPELSKSEQNLETLTNKADDVNTLTRENTLDAMQISQNRELIRETYFDKATGLLNRNGLALGENILRNGKKLSVANFDADHFRASNELKGRGYGDAQIKIIAKNINQTVMKLRSEGYKAYAVRMGGEEFTLMTTAPQEVLHKHMLDMSAKTKQEMLSTLSTDEKAKMAEHIAKTKYADDPNGVNKAYSELGGISGSVIGVDGKALNWKQKGNMKKTLMYADASMEDLKKMHGRGNFELDRRDPTSTSRRINEFKIHNVLDATQKGNLGKETKRLFGSAEKQFDNRLQLFNSVIEKADEKSRAIFKEDLRKVLESPDSTIKDISKVLAKYNVDTSLAAKLKERYVANLRDHGSYTGARTMTSYQKEMTGERSRFEAKNSWKIEIGKFKSINETLGHVGGDAYLTFVYQDVIMGAVKELGIPFGTNNDALIVSQKGADYHFCFSSEYLASHPKIEIKFQQALNKRYKKMYKVFVKKINQGSTKDYQKERDKWLKENEQANPDAINQQYNLYFHQ